MSKIYEKNMSATAARTTGRTLDYAAPLYDKLAPLMVFGFEQRCAGLVIKSMELEPNHKILDVGCGTGSLTLKIAGTLDKNSDGKVIGIDAAEAMLAIARKKTAEYPNVTFEAELAENLPYPDETFDRSVSTFFFHHINYDLKLKALHEMWRTLKPGGKTVIVDIDIPTTLLGKICAWSGYKLFHQEEIKENIDGKLRDAFNASDFKSWKQISHHSGYMTLFKLER